MIRRSVWPVDPQIAILPSTAGEVGGLAAIFRGYQSLVTHDRDDAHALLRPTADRGDGEQEVADSVMDLAAALAYAAAKKHGVLITLRADGRPQSSDVAFLVRDGTFVISLTNTRAKTHNMRRDPRAVVHLTDPSTWTYVSFDGTVSLSPVAITSNDATNDALVAYYERVAGQEHPDWAEYRQAMVAEQRLLATFTPTSAVGQIH